MLKDDNSSVRWAAARALGDIGDLETIGPLTGAFKDVNSGVRWAAYKAADSICRRFNTQDRPPRVY
jgi:HEAT repeat protein